jgi:hypothetical protein
VSGRPQRLDFARSQKPGKRRGDSSSCVLFRCACVSESKAGRRGGGGLPACTPSGAVLLCPGMGGNGMGADAAGPVFWGSVICGSLSRRSRRWVAGGRIGISPPPDLRGFNVRMQVVCLTAFASPGICFLKWA